MPTSRRTCHTSQAGFLNQAHSKAVPASPELAQFIPPLSSTSQMSPSSSYNSLSSCTIPLLNPLGSHFYISVLVKGINRSIRSFAMLDSRATALFVSKHFVQRHHIICLLLPREIALHNINSTKNKAGSLSHFICLTLTLSTWSKPTDFLVMDLEPKDVILGLL